jgi:hypothetical protein
MKSYIHARLGVEERRALERLKRTTGASDSDLVRRGLRLVLAEVEGGGSALDAAGSSVGKFSGGPADLSTNPHHLDEFGR